MNSPNFSARDRVRTNKYHDFPGATGTVDETWTTGPNEDFPQATIEWDNPDEKLEDIVPFEELEYIPDPNG